MAKYWVEIQLRMDGTDHMIGDEIELEPGRAETLLKTGTVRLLPEAAKEAAEPPESDESSVDEPQPRSKKKRG